MVENTRCPVCKGSATLNLGKLGIGRCTHCAGSGFLTPEAETGPSVDKMAQKTNSGATTIRLVIVIAALACLLVFYTWHANS